jgi:lipoic acid synthetase
MELKMRKPEWLRIKVQGGRNKSEVEDLLRKLSLHTVCEEANCPNLMECFGRKTATFLILGKNCTRHCTFCNVEKGVPENADPAEPHKIADAVNTLGLKHVVITSVTRDDLSDGGAGHFAFVIHELKKNNPDVVVEVLIPDFQGDESSLIKVTESAPDIINHNVETVPSLYEVVRPEADYNRSLQLLRNIKIYGKGIYSKSGIMLGLGEKENEVIEVMEDLRKAGCDFLTIGQYLAPSQKHHPVVEYVHPSIFLKYKTTAFDMGFKFAASGPFVRSSYNAESLFSCIK